MIGALLKYVEPCWLPYTFWAKFYLVNLSLNSSIKFNTPFELWWKWLGDYSMLRIFGCDDYSLNRKYNRTKYDHKAKKCTFLDYQRVVKGYKLWDVMLANFFPVWMFLLMDPDHWIRGRKSSLPLLTRTTPLPLTPLRKRLKLTSLMMDNKERFHLLWNKKSWLLVSLI